VSAREIRSQPFSRLQLMRFNQRPPIAAAPAGEPNERAFRLVDCDAGMAEASDDLSFRKDEMLRAKAVNCRLRRLRASARRLSALVSLGLLTLGLRRLQLGDDHRRCPFRIIYLYRRRQTNLHSQEDTTIFTASGNLLLCARASAPAP
jgi:hypothetical protein